MCAAILEKKKTQRFSGSTLAQHWTLFDPTSHDAMLLVTSRGFAQFLWSLSVTGTKMHWVWPINTNRRSAFIVNVETLHTSISGPPRLAALSLCWVAAVYYAGSVFVGHRWGRFCQGERWSDIELQQPVFVNGAQRVGPPDVFQSVIHCESCFSIARRFV